MTSSRHDVIGSHLEIRTYFWKSSFSQISTITLQPVDQNRSTMPGNFLTRPDQTLAPSSDGVANQFQNRFRIPGLSMQVARYLIFLRGVCPFWKIFFLFSKRNSEKIFNSTIPFFQLKLLTVHLRYLVMYEHQVPSHSFASTAVYLYTFLMSPYGDRGV